MRNIHIIKKKPDKKTILLAAAVLVLLAALIFAGVHFLRAGQNEEPSLEEIVTGKLNAYQTDLADSLDSLQTSRDAAQYLLSWGKNKGISCSIDSHDNVTYTLNGPTGSERVGDHRATHRWGFAVLYGSIVEVSYDLYDVRTDKLISHYSMNSIVAPRGVDQNFLFSITGKDGVYVLQAEGNAVFHFTSIDKAVNAICKYPASYI